MEGYALEIGVQAASPSVSVVIPTLNRERLLGDAIAELLSAPSHHLLEVIVVDQSDAANERLSTIDDPRLRYFRADFKNLPKARNVGTSQSRGDVILFLDDDVRDLSNIVDAHAEAHLTGISSIITGPILSPGQKLRLVSELSTAELDLLPTGTAMIYDADASFVPDQLIGANMSFRRSVLHQIGGFDENFIGNAIGEDCDVSHRAKAIGFPPRYVPSAGLTHIQEPSGGTRSEDDLAKRMELGLLNGHYFHTKINRRDRLWGIDWRALRTYALNRQLLQRRRFDLMAYRTGRFAVAVIRAELRARRLLRRKPAR